VLILVGTQNRAKIAAASAVLTHLYGPVELRPVTVSIPVPAQPLSDAVTQEGAIARARASVNTPGAAFGIGLEGGLRETLAGWALCSWAAVVDARGALGLGAGPILPLPARVSKRVLSGEELGPVMDELTGQHDIRQGPGAFGILTGGAINRQRVFEEALICAFARWRHPAYGL